MILTHVNPVRVEKVVFVSGSDLESDFDLAAWQAIQPLVEKIDKALKTTFGQSLRTPRKGPQREGGP